MVGKGLIASEVWVGGSPEGLEEESEAQPLIINLTVALSLNRKSC